MSDIWRLLSSTADIGAHVVIEQEKDDQHEAADQEEMEVEQDGASSEREGLENQSEPEKGSSTGNESREKKSQDEQGAEMDNLTMASQHERTAPPKAHRVLKAHGSHPEAPAKKKIQTERSKDEDCSHTSLTAMQHPSVPEVI